MQSHDHQPDFGTGQKTLGIYVIGLIACIILTLISFGSVMYQEFPRGVTFAIIYSSAIIQFLIQVICFLRLNTQTEQGKLNVMSFIFTGVILFCLVVGSLWIMSNLHYNLMP
jgi:cytochrome o ubiquinol oxidase subunit IV